MRFFKATSLLFAVLVPALWQVANATHYRAGEIIYTRIDNLKYEATVITYSKISPPSNLADRDSVEIFWGDGTSNILARINGPDANGNGVPDGQLVGPDIQMNKYRGVHTYPGVPPPPNRYYIIHFYDENRMAGIINIGNSVNVPFYVEDTLRFPTDINNIGVNSSPVLAHPPIDFANLNDTFYHNPVAIDPDGDSLDFRFMTPLQDSDLDVPLYVMPDDYCQSQGSANNIITIDRHTGHIMWAVPCRQGIFNIAILITEFREGIKMGTMIRDMQIIVLDIPNHPPQLADIPDTCVYANDTLVINVRATDPEAGQIITLTAEGGPFMSSPPPVFNHTSGNPATGVFRWIPSCDAIQGQPYVVLFGATDNFSFGNSPAPLSDFVTTQITVIAPPVQNVNAVAGSNGVTISWQNPYECSGAANFRGFSVWRKTGCEPFNPSHCQAGMGGLGFTKLVDSLYAYSFTDNSTIVGQQYSYVVIANFYKLSPNGIFAFDRVASAPSQQVCVFTPIDVPVILNADVQQTDVTNGSVFVRWARPRAGGIHLDTLQITPPYRFDLLHSTGFNGANTVIHSTVPVNSYSALVDTTFTDAAINTTDGPWNYRVDFYAHDSLIGSSSIASTIYLDVYPSDQSLLLQWSENVPWTNDSFSIFKLNPANGLFDSIGTSYTHAYPDTGLINDSTYCYYVKGYGHYSVAGFPIPLINKSQQDCAVPTDTVPPCPPTLSIINDCDKFFSKPWDNTSFINYLSWINQLTACADDINHYHIYFGNDSTGMALIDSIMSRNDTVYNHIRNDNSLTGCYAVTAVDRAGNESVLSNVVCVDNCPYYVLPNAFTPNGDGDNDVFHPFKPYRFVEKIDMKIYDRWGVLLFETHDPEINWKGTDKQGKAVGDGVYEYAGYYYVRGINGLNRYPLSGEKKGGGFIHLITGK